MNINTLSNNIRDRMGLSAACCPVCEHGSVVSIQHTVQKISCRGFVHVALRCILVEDSIESESLVLHTLSLRYDGSGEALNGIVLGRVEDAGYA